MPPLERVWEDRNRTPVLLVSGAIITIVALVDWWTKPYVSLGFLPHGAKLAVQHKDGEVHIDDVTGNIEVKARQGLIALRLVSEMPPAFDAKSDFGSVNSDFNGDEHRHPWPFGHQFVQSASAAPQNLRLRIGYGDIVILKAHNPQAPPAASE